MKTVLYRVIGPNLKAIEDSKSKNMVIEFTNINEGVESKVGGIVLDYNEAKKEAFVTITFRIIKADEKWIKVDHDYPIEYNFETLKGEINLSPKDQLEVGLVEKK